MKRKTLISVVLLLIMLLSCIVPSFGVYATEPVTNTITLNSELYSAVSDYLKSNYTGFSYNDLLRRITSNGTSFSNVEKLDLSGWEIEDLTGLEVFSGLKDLELSGNNLTEESNLEVINSFGSLEILDLSTNKIGDFSALSLDKYKDLQLHSQAVKKVEIVSLPYYTADVDTSISKDFTGFLANIDSGIVDFEKNMITNTNIEPMNNNAKIKVDTQNSKLKGVTLYSIYGDDGVKTVESIERRMYNLNVTVNSGLYDESVVDLYYITILEDEEGIVFKDEKFYNVVKEQLTSGQITNPYLNAYNNCALSSGVVAGDSDNGANKVLSDKMDEVDVNILGNKENTIYNEITENAREGARLADKLKYAGEHIGQIQAFESENYILYVTATQYTECVGMNPQGSWNYIIYKKTDRIEKNIYAASFDEVLTLVIKKDDIINKIPSLVAENCMIEDLTGLEHFVGLESNLNLSNNYIDSIEKVIELAQNKIDKEAELRTKVRNDVSKIKTLKDKIKEYDEIINKTCSEIDADDHDITTCEECKKVAEDKAKAQNNKQTTTAFLEKAVDQLYSHYETINEATIIIPIELYNLTNVEISNLIDEDAEKYFNSVIDKLCKMYDVGVWGNPAVTDNDGNVINSNAEDELGYYFHIASEIIDGSAEKGMTSSTVKEYLADYNVLEEDARFDKYRQILKAYKNQTSTVILNTEYDIDTLTPNNPTTYMDLANAYAYLVTDTAAIDRFVVLPRLKYLDMSANDIELLEGLEILKELLVLDMEDNLILTVENVDWTKLAELTQLNLTKNQLTNISSLSAIKKLEYLQVAYNLLSGTLDFEFGNYYEYLREINLSGNYYDNVQIILDMYSSDARQANKTIREYLSSLGVNVLLHNQIIYKNYGDIQETDGSVTVQLPEIFKQIEEIDPKATSFGVAPGKGDVYKKGAEAILQNVVDDNARVQITSVDSKNLSIGDSTTCYMTFESIENNNTNAGEIPTPPTTSEDNNTNQQEQLPDGTKELTAEDIVIYEDGDSNKYIYVYEPDSTVASLVEVLNSTEEYGVNRVNNSTEFENDTTRLYTSETVSLITGTGHESVVDVYEVVVIGDVDGDGDIDSIDSGYARALRYESLYKDIEDKAERIELMNAFEATSNFKAADMVVDGEIDKVETRAILYYRAGLIDSFDEFAPKG